MDLGLLQKEVAAKLGVTLYTIIHWEKGYHQPPINRLARVYDFLGYCLLDITKPGKGIGKGIRKWREGLGLSLRELALGAKVDESKLWQWEEGRRKPWPVSVKRIEMFLATEAGLPVELT